MFSLSINFIQHSLIKVPNNDYTPRLDDPRIGYFTNRVTDMTSSSHTPYRDLIHRWDLRKKQPKKSLSTAKIVYNLESVKIDSTMLEHYTGTTPCRGVPRKIRGRGTKGPSFPGAFLSAPAHWPRLSRIKAIEPPTSENGTSA